VKPSGLRVLARPVFESVRLSFNRLNASASFSAEAELIAEDEVIRKKTKIKKPRYRFIVYTSGKNFSRRPVKTKRKETRDSLLVVYVVLAERPFHLPFFSLGQLIVYAHQNRPTQERWDGGPLD